MTATPALIGQCTPDIFNLDYVPATVLPGGGSSTLVGTCIRHFERGRARGVQMLTSWLRIGRDTRVQPARVSYLIDGAQC